VTYAGPAFEGCCGAEQGGNPNQVLECCKAGGCCGDTEGGGGGGFLDCCAKKTGSLEHNRRKSEVRYAGPSYDGCCPKQHTAVHHGGGLYTL
jgi:hypothetical protein